jgi:hypothetical protein
MLYAVIPLFVPPLAPLQVKVVLPPLSIAVGEIEIAVGAEHFVMVLAVIPTLPLYPLL